MRPSAARAGGIAVQVVRTVPEKIYDVRAARRLSHPRELHARAAPAPTLIYLESQFLWSPQIVEILAHKLREPPSDDFRVVVLLPAKPNNGADDTRGQLGALVDADNGAGASSRRRSRARSGRLTRPAVRAREDRDRRRPLADDRLGQPQRALAVQRHRDEHRHLRPTRSRVRPGCGCGPSTSSARSRGVAATAARDRRRAVAADRRRAAPAPRRAARPLTHRLRELPGVSRRSMALLGPLAGPRRRRLTARSPSRARTVAICPARRAA